MNIHDWITLATGGLVAVGWFVTGIFNRKNEVAIKRKEMRVAAYQSFLLVVQEIDRSGRIIDYVDVERIKELTVQAGRLAFMYCDDDVVTAIQNFSDEVHSGIQDHSKTISHVYRLIRNRLRKELGIKID